jgi:diguanylate cyclase (GGDEF)-like protein
MLMLQDVLGSATPGQAPPAVLLINLNRFKNVNDTLGTEAGDILLRMVGDRLAATIAEEDMLARSAGNEFAVALARPESRAVVAAKARQMLEKLSHPYLIEGQPMTIDARMGIAHAPADGHTAEELLANAGLALRDVDPYSPHRLRFFDAELTARAQQRRGLEADLRLALARHEFTLHYQAQVDVHHNCVTGLEALIRWQNAERGMVAPGDFIPLAEEIGLIVEIGDWVLREACRTAALWPAEVTVAVNASPLQFETGDFAQSVADALASTGLTAARLEIEITESLLLRDTGTVLATLAALQDMGVRLVLDDFGTGYASLSQLSRFRFDKIKIDRSFVSPADASAENSAIVRSIAALAHSLGIPSTAEGVETQIQLDQIKADGCTCVQGYYLSRPVPASAVAEVLARLHHPEPIAA